MERRDDGGDGDASNRPDPWPKRSERPDGDRPTSSTNWQGKQPASSGGRGNRIDSDRPTSSTNWQGAVLGLRVASQTSKGADASSPDGGQLALCVAPARASLALETSSGDTLQLASATATVHFGPRASTELASADALIVDVHPARAFAQGKTLPTIRPLIERAPSLTIGIGDADWTPVDRASTISFHDGAHGVALERGPSGAVIAIRLLSRTNGAPFGDGRAKTARFERGALTGDWRASPRVELPPPPDDATR